MSSSQALESALTAFADGPSGDAAVLDAAALAAGGRAPRDPAFRARETGAIAADCAEGLHRALAAARELTAGMLGFEPDLSGGAPYDDVDTVRAAWVCHQAAGYLAAAVTGGDVTGPATLAGLTAGLAAAARPMAALLAWLGDWLSHEITAGRVTGTRPAAGLAADARATLEAAAARAAELASALQAAHELAASTAPLPEGPGPQAPVAGVAREVKRLRPSLVQEAMRCPQ